MNKHWEHTEYLNDEQYDSFILGAKFVPSTPLPYNIALYVDHLDNGCTDSSRKRLECIYDGETKCIRPIKTKGANRDLRLYKDALNNKNITMLAVDGLVGTGKTSTLIEYLIEKNLKDVDLSDRVIDGTGVSSFLSYSVMGDDNDKATDRKILIAKPAVNSAGEEYGFLPGDINEKMTPTLRNYTQYFDRLHPAGFELLRENGYVDILPLGFIRGMDADNMDIIVDEAQNTKELITVATRHAKDARTFFIGDTSPFQIDRENNTPEKNGLSDFIDLMNGAPYFQYIEMKSLEHIVRSDEVRDIMRRMFKKHGRNPKEWIMD